MVARALSLAFKGVKACRATSGPPGNGLTAFPYHQVVTAGSLKEGFEDITANTFLLNGSLPRLQASDSVSVYKVSDLRVNYMLQMWNFSNK